MTSPPDVYVDPNGKNMRRWPYLMTNRRMAVRLEKFFDKPGFMGAAAWLEERHGVMDVAS
jgi:hypothetical protein